MRAFFANVMIATFSGVFNVELRILFVWDLVTLGRIIISQRNGLCAV
jgi:hypothetical protein